MNQIMQPNPLDQPSRVSAESRLAREEWMHDFRNALGNVTIAASAAASQLVEIPDPVLRAAMAEIEAGCQRCLKLLRTMPA
ncbi:MAG TPA: hypothetical protein VGH80_12315 [Xanthomonadaceae bacterium]|jgi:hypothetical protein